MHKQKIADCADDGNYFLIF